MDQDDFLEFVGSAAVLTPEESLDIVLYNNGYTPRQQLSFPDKCRVGPWKEELFSSVTMETGRIINWQRGSYFESLSATVVVEMPTGYILLSSIFFVNNCDRSVIKTISLKSKSSNEIYKMENRFHKGHQLFEAKFNPPVEMRTGNIAVWCSVMCSSEDEFYGVSRVKGQQATHNRIGNISMGSLEWNYVVGFKYKNGTSVNDILAE